MLGFAMLSRKTADVISVKKLVEGHDVIDDILCITHAAVASLMKLLNNRVIHRCFSQFAYDGFWLDDDPAPRMWSRSLPL